MNSFEGIDRTNADSLEKRSGANHSDLMLSRGQWILLFLIAGTLLLALVSFGLYARSLRQDILVAENEIGQIQAQLAAGVPPPPELRPLLATLEALEQQAVQFEDAADTLPDLQIYWPGVTDILLSYDPQQLSLTALEQNGRQIVLEGEASSDEVVLDYAQRLDASGLFARVLIESMKPLDRDVATMSPTPTLTPTPTVRVTETVTPTPTLRDAYEVDDVDPVPIFLNQPQARNFYPVDDVDRVTFLAKARRYYRIYTEDLRPGVDTVLEVVSGDEVYRNDDHAAGLLSSEVIFQVGPDDTDVVVNVTNRGQYGPDQQYSIGVEEILPTLTPSPTPTSSPMPQSPTPDLRDAFEPDQPIPATIAVGETQGHNFYPEGDVDDLTFLARGGRTYRISTSNLSLGVDTVLTVVVGAEVYVHDDRSPGDLGSEVIVTVPEDRDYQALVTVENRGQYGAQLYYQISVKEITLTPTLTPSPSPMPSPSPSLTSTSTVTVSSASLIRPPGLARTLPQRHQIIKPAADRLGAPQMFTGPDAVRFVITLDLKAEAP